MLPGFALAAYSIVADDPDAWDISEFQRKRPWWTLCLRISAGFLGVDSSPGWSAFARLAEKHETKPNFT